MRKLVIAVSPFSVVLDVESITGDCCDWGFGIRWTPEEFISYAVAVGYPFMFFFQGCQPKSKTLAYMLRKVRICVDRRQVQQVG